MYCWKYSKNVIKRNSKVIYYDCTNYFFEIDSEDDIRKYGISKEHRPNPIVGMRLFKDGDGLPLCLIFILELDDTKIILCTNAGLASDEIKKFKRYL